ncbi:GNAT family N-acetyltransferase [Mycoplasmatota bacterium WC44]
MEYMIKTVETIDKLNKLFYFFSRTFYHEDKARKTNYNFMNERYEEMKKQFLLDPSLLFYVEHNMEIVAGLTIKNRKENNIATIGLIAVKKEFRGMGIGELLIKSTEDICNQKGIVKLNLGARPYSIDFYSKIGYSPTLMVQIFDFETIENVKKVNENYKNFSVINEYKDVAYGYIFFEIDEVDVEIIKHFEDKLDVCQVLYVFTKDIHTGI